MELRTKIKIKGQAWGIYVLSAGKFNNFIGTDCVGASTFTNNEKTRCIYFKGSPSLSTIHHELIHVFLSYSRYGTIGYSNDTNEEIVCCTLEKNLLKIIKLGKVIFDATR